MCPPSQMHLAGQQKMFNIFSLRSGGSYIIQVRCKPDHGFWSEWSSPFQIRVPDCKNTAQSNHTQSLPLHICHPYNNTRWDWKLYKSTCFVVVADFQPEKAVWVLITVFAAFLFLIFTWLLHMNSSR